jgi:hypothetical protein
MEATGGRDVGARRADHLPQHPAAVVVERHAKVVEVPKDGAESAQLGGTKDHVVAVEADGVAIDGEELLTDLNGNV